MGDGDILKRMNYDLMLDLNMAIPTGRNTASCWAGKHHSRIKIAIKPPYIEDLTYSIYIPFAMLHIL